MSFIKPKGVFRWIASQAADVAEYILFAKQADATPPEATQLDMSNAVAVIPAVPGQTDYSYNLSDIPGLLGANGENYVFAVASRDSAGNVSDFSEKVVIALDETAPDAPGNFTYSAD